MLGVISVVQVVILMAIGLSGRPAGLDQLAWLAPSRWGFAAVAATTDLTRIAPQSPDLTADPLWAHQAGTWLADMAAMIALPVLFVIIAWWRLNRLSPGRRHR